MKIGLGDSYDNVSILSQKTRAYLDLTKPASSLGVGGAYLLGSLFYFYYIGNPSGIQSNLMDIIYTVVTITLAHGASQCLNMAEDAEIDSNTEHKKNRPIPSGIVSKEEARTISWILMIFALGRAYIVGGQFGAVVSILIFMGIFYNLGPIRAKKRRFSIPWQAVSRGLLSFPAIWAAYGNMWNPTPWALGLFMFFYVLGFQNSADIIDMETDREYGMKTFAVMYGVKGIAVIASGSTLMMVAVVLASYGFGLIRPVILSMLLIIPFCIYMLKELWCNPYKIDDSTGNHPSWKYFYVGMVLTVVIPLLDVMIY